MIRRGAARAVIDCLLDGAVLRDDAVDISRSRRRREIADRCLPGEQDRVILRRSWKRRSASP